MKIKLATSGLCMFILFALAFVYINNQNKHSNKDIEWINKWLTSPTCNPPCWEGITPGITTIDEAENVLRKNSLIQVDAQEENYISWHFEMKNNAGGSIVSENNGNTIDLIRLRPNTQSKDILLGDVIEKYGEPNQVMFTATDSSRIIIYLVYAKKNMALVLALKSKSPYTISPTLNILGIDLFASGYDFSEFELTSVTSTVKWVGYSQYKP